MNKQEKIELIKKIREWAEEHSRSYEKTEYTSGMRDKYKSYPSCVKLEYLNNFLDELESEDK